ncbi:hypothetical protein JCM6882_009763 [Rhodosporidiobolus microsporus]
MAFSSSHPTIQPGDWIIVFESRSSVSSEIVTPGKENQSRYGCFRHNDMVGKPWGFKLTSTNNRGFVFLLKPTPELWTLALPHRTQILYLPDIAFITSYLDVKPGSQIIEAGTGSGSFSHSLARTVGKGGKVHSFEYHEERFGKAKEEFKAHGLDDVITIKHQNVYKDGFGGLENQVDSVFLDLPAPWEALEHAKKAMRKDRQARICCFSPCIEQVIRTCSALAELGFSDITMYETLTRTHDPHQVTAPSISSAIDRIREVEQKKERRREGQIEDARRKREEKKRKAEEEEAAAAAAAAAAGEERGEAGAGTEDAHVAKKVKVDEGNAAVKMDEGLTADSAAASSAPEPDLAPSTSSSTASPAPVVVPASSSAPAAANPPVPVPGRHAGKALAASAALSKEDREFTAKVGPYSRGHTSYLTFAVLLPQVQVQVGEREVVEVEEKPAKEKKEEAPAAVADAAAVPS